MGVDGRVTLFYGGSLQIGFWNIEANLKNFYNLNEIAIVKKETIIYYYLKRMRLMFITSF